MFSNLLFLIIVLLLINMGQEMQMPLFWNLSPTLSFLLAMLTYAALLGVIFLQNIFFKKFLRKNKNKMLYLVNLELIIFLCFYYFFLNAHKFFDGVPLLGLSTIISYLFAFALYLGGLAVFHITAYPSRNETANLEEQSRWSTAIIEMRMLIPFALPFLVFTFLANLVQMYPDPQFHEKLNKLLNTPFGIFLSVSFSLIFLASALILLPPIIQWFWQCKPLESGPLLDKINALCQKARFKNGGIKTWGIMNNSLTAAIIGIVPRFRYIIFTKRLLREMEPEWIEAILGHEIGHNYRKHLIIYPFIIFGMIACTYLFSLLFSESITTFFSMQMEQYPSPIWFTLFPITIFLSYAIIIALYFRFIFGFFSRLFERQADLHVFALGIDPEHMISALRYVGQATGTINSPNWHHYSIRQRLEFLERASQHTSLISEHHRKVRMILILYFLWLALMVFILVAPFFPEVPFFSQANNLIDMVSSNISNFINHPEGAFYDAIPN